MQISNCFGDLHLIDRSSFTLEPRSNTLEETQPHNPFLRTQSLFKKKASQENLSRHAHQQSTQEIPFQLTSHRHEPPTENATYGDGRLVGNDMSFFDSFGKTLDDRQLRIKTEPCEGPAKSRVSNEPECQIRPVTQFFLNLNNLGKNESHTKSKSKTSTAAKPPKSTCDLFETVKRLHCAMEEADEESRANLTEEIPEKLLVELRRLTIKLELINRQNQQNRKSSRYPKLVKERDCLDRNRKVHIEMVKVDHRSPECNSYRKGRSNSKSNGLYALKSRLNLK